MKLPSIYCTLHLFFYFLLNACTSLPRDSSALFCCACAICEFHPYFIEIYLFYKLYVVLSDVSNFDWFLFDMRCFVVFAPLANLSLLILVHFGQMVFELGK